jgi:hypothetical protein
MTNQVGYACGRVKILHRSSSPVGLATFADAVNLSPEPRVTTTPVASSPNPTELVGTYSNGW